MRLRIPLADGFSVFRGADYGFMFPSDWRELVDDAVFTTRADAEIVGPPGARGLPALISSYSTRGFRGDFESFLFNFNSNANLALPGRTVLRREAVHIQNAVDALLVESVYAVPGYGRDPNPDPESGNPRLRQVDLLVLTRAGTTIDLRASAPADDFDRWSLMFGTVLNSLRIEPLGSA